MFKVVLYNPVGGWTAESIIRFDESNVKIPLGESYLQLVLENINLRNGCYRLGIILIGGNGAFLGWSYKREAITIINSCVGSHAECILVSRLNFQKT